jgi:hypothetical protein
MKLSLRNIKTALDVSTQKRAVSDLVKSGTRSVRVISEAQVIRLIEVCVEDALAHSGHVSPEERDKVVAAAKEHYDEVMQQQAETEARNKRQEETILSLQQRITQLVNEKTQLSMAQRELETQLDAAMRRAAIAGEHPAAVGAAPAPAVDNRTPDELNRLTEKMGQLQQLVSRLETKSDAPAPAAPAPAVDNRTPDELNRLTEQMGQLQQLVSRLETKRGPDVADLDSRLQQLMARIEAKGGTEAAELEARLEKSMQSLVERMQAKSGGAGGSADLDTRLEKSMQKLIDRFGRTVAGATAKPIESRQVEATDALIGKMLADDVTMASNIGDLEIEERKAEGDVNKSLERLRRTQKKPKPNGAKDQTATWDRRRGPDDRRDASSEGRPEDADRRGDQEDRRNPL